MKANGVELPVPVLRGPHWRVNFSLDEYKGELIPTLKKCFEIVEKNKLSLRGWDYPHLSNFDTERGVGNNWVASWSDFMGHLEYWRLYQSGQFLHLFSVGEATRPEWRQKLQSQMRRLSFMQNIDWENVPGFISILNFIYTMTEIFEFASRLCQAEVYKGILNIDIRLKGIKGFVLSAEGIWRNYYSATDNEIGSSWSFESDFLVAKSADQALNTIAWFFERFGWLSPSINVFRQDQENFLKGRI
jgi:hypothetical protein